MKINGPSQVTREQRFDQYLTMLSEAVDHPDRAKALRDYCTGLLLPVERKSIDTTWKVIAQRRFTEQHGVQNRKE